MRSGDPVKLSRAEFAIIGISEYSTGLGGYNHGTEQKFLQAL